MVDYLRKTSKKSGRTVNLRFEKKLCLSEYHPPICVLGFSLFCKIQPVLKTHFEQQILSSQAITEPSSQISLKAMGCEQRLTHLAILDRTPANFNRPMVSNRRNTV